MAIVQTKGRPGTITVTANSNGLQPASVVINAR